MLIENNSIIGDKGKRYDIKIKPPRKEVKKIPRHSGCVTVTVVTVKI